MLTALVSVCARGAGPEEVANVGHMTVRRFHFGVCLSFAGGQRAFPCVCASAGEARNAARRLHSCYRTALQVFPHVLDARLLYCAAVSHWFHLVYPIRPESFAIGSIHTANVGHCCYEDSDVCACSGNHLGQIARRWLLRAQSDQVERP